MSGAFRRHWTTADIRRIRQLARGGLPVIEIALVMAATVSSLRALMKRNAIPLPTPEMRLVRTQIAKEISAARAEAATAPPYKPGPLVW